MSYMKQLFNKYSSMKNFMLNYWVVKSRKKSDYFIKNARDVKYGFLFFLEREKYSD